MCVCVRGVGGWVGSGGGGQPRIHADGGPTCVPAATPRPLFCVWKLLAQVWRMRFMKGAARDRAATQDLLYGTN